MPPIPGVNLGHHDLSHHGQDPTKIAQLRTVELEKLRTFRAFLAKWKETREQDSNLLDRTTLFFSSNLGNASSHSTRNLPVLLVGGGFRHGQHLAFDPSNPPPLSNLYVTVLQRLGINANRFGSSTGSLRGLESAQAQDRSAAWNWLGEQRGGRSKVTSATLTESGNVKALSALSCF